ncbi:MAG: peroxiredoxin-like family protein [Pseudomonadota bacterium]
MSTPIVIAIAASLFTVFISVFTVIQGARQKAASSGPLSVGSTLPNFSVQTESGEAVSSTSLAGQRAVLLFVRGSWCPFCNQQVEALTSHYRRITEGGGRLIIVTPKPLDTTRHVADAFGVDFDFWLDEDLAAAKTLGIADSENVPARFREQFGEDTMVPTVVVTDSDRIIRFHYQSKNPQDRPDPARFMGVFDASS